MQKNAKYEAKIVTLHPKQRFKMKEDNVKLRFVKSSFSAKQELPLAGGGIRAGFPSPAQDYMEDAIDFNPDFILHPECTFYARCEGDSMIEDGIYDGDPKNPSSKVIEKVAPGTDLSEYIHREKSSFGRGGMESKYHTASSVAKEGINVIIANGTRDNILVDLITAPETVLHTEFQAP